MAGYHRFHFSQLDSTNVEAKRIIDKGEAKHGMLITADYQTQGRGQFGRAWHSDQAQNTMMSLIIQPDHLLIKDQYALNLMASLGVSDVIRDYGLNAKVKWPNDIYVSDKKICGILIQNYLQGSHIQHAVIGIGLNTNQLSWPEDVPNPTSLAIELDQQLSINDLVDQVAKSIMKRYSLIDGQAQALRDDYHSIFYRKGEITSFDLDGQMISGEIQGIDEHGRLLVKHGEELAAYQHGEISMVI